MLIAFRFKNFRSYKDETCVSFNAESDTQYIDSNTFALNDKYLGINNTNRLLFSVATFSEAPAGSSNIMKALAKMYNLTILSDMKSFQLYNENDSNFSSSDNEMYEVDFIINNNCYKYGFIVSGKMILKEWLYKKCSRNICIFKRNQQKVYIWPNRKNDSSYITIPPSILYVTISCDFKNDIQKYTEDVQQFFLKIMLNFKMHYNSFDFFITENAKYLNQAIDILHKIDSEIYSFKIIKEKLKRDEHITDVIFNNTITQTIAIAKLRNIKSAVDLDVILNYKSNTDNIRSLSLLKDSDYIATSHIKLIQNLAWILAALDNGCTLFMDDFDLYLSPKIISFLLSLFNNPKINKHSAQLFANMSSLLSMNNKLRRDQIYIIEQNSEMNSTLFSLSEIKNVRKNEAYLKNYLDGKYSKN